MNGLKKKEKKMEYDSAMRKKESLSFVTT